MSLNGTCSFFKNKESSQNKAVEPANRRKVSENGSISSGMMVRERGVLRPNIRLAPNRAI